MSMKILVIEDDRAAASFMCNGLAQAGHTADAIHDGREGLAAATIGEFDVIVVDRMLPGLDGLAVVRALRAAGDGTPVLVLSALADVDHRVEGLAAGGDDYLVKPYAFSELLARLEALDRRAGRRTSGAQPEVKLAYADLEMDLMQRRVTRAGAPIDLKPREFRLLEALLRNAGRVMTRTMLLEKVWSYHFDPQTNLIDVHISRLRQKIDKDFHPPLIQTIRGAGYSLRTP